MTPLLIADLEARETAPHHECPGCGQHSDNRVFLQSECHPKLPLFPVYEKGSGVLRLLCVCGKVAAVVKVAAS